MLHVVLCGVVRVGYEHKQGALDRTARTARQAQHVTARRGKLRSPDCAPPPPTPPLVMA